MKTLNLTLRAILLTLALAGTTTTALAYDFMVNGIYYNFYGDEATVTYKYSNYQNGSTCYFNDNTGHVTIPETVTYNGNTYTVTSIGNYAFYNSNNDYLITSISIPRTVTSIGKYAFHNCCQLTEITIPTSVITISDYAFNYCTKLSCVIIPNSVTSIGRQAFNMCQAVTNIIIGNSVSYIGEFAFYCGSDITCLAVVPPTIGSNDAFSSPSSRKLYVPKESVELYKTSPGWNFFTNVFGFGNDSFSVPDNSMAFHGDTIVIPVSMQNESEITAFQTDIYLPDGFELVQQNGEYTVSLSDRKARDHVIMASTTPDGALRVVSYSPTLKPFKNNEGELFYFSVKVPEGYSGTYPIWLRNTILTSTDEEELYAIDALSNVSVTNIIKGDANADGLVTVTDVVETARYILYQNPEPFVFEAADMNGDGKITITDVVKIANLVLDQNYEEPTNMRMMAPNVDGDCMSGEAIGNTISINLDNEQDYTAFQMDLTLPEGMAASDFELTNRASDLGLIAKDRGHSKIRVLAYNPNLKTIKGNDGAVLTFNVDGMRGDIMVDGIQMVTPNGESVHLDGFNIAANHFTELNVVTAGKTVTNVKYFNLAGQQIVEPADGVTLVVTTYNDCSRTTNKIIR